MSEPKRFSRQDIDRITYDVPSLDQPRREKVRHMLYRLHDEADGMLYPEHLHRELTRMWESNEISEIEFHDVQNAFFGD